VFIAAPETRFLSYQPSLLARRFVYCGMKTFPLKVHCVGIKWGKIGEVVIGFSPPNKLDLTLRALNHCAKFHQNRIKIAAVGVFIDRLAEWRKWFYNLSHAML